MNRILHRTFDGLVPRQEPSGLPENAAQIATDVDLRRGVLTPVLGRLADTREGYAVGASARTIYLWRYTDHTLTTHTLGTTTAATWEALHDTGKFKITVDGTVYECTPSFHGATTMAAVAAAIQTAIRAKTLGVETVTYVAASGGTGAHFVIRGNAVVTTIAAPASGTDLAAAGYLNGDGTAATATGEKWLHWDGDVNVVASPVNDDQYHRVYYTGDGLPKMHMRLAGVDVTREMKIEAPSAAPTVTGTAFVAASDTAARAAFTISEARVSIYLGGSGAGTLVQVVATSFTRTGDVITIPAKTIDWLQAADTSWSYVLEFKVNSKWEKGNETQHIDIYDATGQYKLTFDTDAGWHAHTSTRSLNVGRPLACSLTFGGALRLTYTDGAATEVTDGSVCVTYCASFVTDLGEEGPLSPATVVYLAESGHDIAISGVPQPTGGTGNTRGIVSTRLYRAAGGAFRWLVDVATGTTTYTDTTPDDDTTLGEVAPEDIANPPDDLLGLTACAGGWFAGFRGREFCASDPFFPTSWPDEYKQTVQDPIVALAAAGNDCYVLTEGRPVQLSGSQPDELTAIHLEADQACVSLPGVAFLGQTILYPSPDGLVAIFAGQAKVVTAPWYRRADWQALVPEDMRATAHDGRYYATLSGSSMLIVDFSESADRITTAATAAVGLYTDMLNDTLYVIEAGEVMVWRGGSSLLQLDWKGRDWLFPHPVSFAALRVLAGSYAVPPVVTLYANGAEVAHHHVADGNAVRLPMLRPERRWSLRVQSYAEITEINLATSIGALTA
jgi:hypothetical protein